jgi:hypothetical protein
MRRFELAVLLTLSCFCSWGISAPSPMDDYPHHLSRLNLNQTKSTQNGPSGSRSTRNFGVPTRVLDNESAISATSRADYRLFNRNPSQMNTGYSSHQQSYQGGFDANSVFRDSSATFNVPSYTQPSALHNEDALRHYSVNFNGQISGTMPAGDYQQQYTLDDFPNPFAQQDYISQMSSGPGNEFGNVNGVPPLLLDGQLGSAFYHGNRFLDDQTGYSTLPPQYQSNSSYSHNVQQHHNSLEHYGMDYSGNELGSYSSHTEVRQPTLASRPKKRHSSKTLASTSQDLAQNSSQALTTPPEHAYRPKFSDTATYGTLLHTGNTPIPSGEHEYTYNTDHYVQSADDNDLVFIDMPDDVREFIQDRLASIRPFRPEVILERIAFYLTAKLARELLSAEDTMIWRAAKELLPDNLLLSVDGSIPVTWMTGLKPAERREVIRRLSQVTLQNSDRLKSFLLETDVSPLVAQGILHAPYSEGIWAIALNFRLFLSPERVRNGRTPKPWHLGLGEVQKLALFQRMRPFMNISMPKKERQTCTNLLGKPKVKSGYGFDLLNVGGDQFPYYMQDLMASVRGDLLRLTFG